MARQELATFTCAKCPRRAEVITTANPTEPRAVCWDCAPRPTFAKTLPRVGRGMLDACIAVSAETKPTKHAVSRQIGPHGSNAYGWAIVQRAIRAGLIRDVGTQARSALELTPLGWQLTADYR